MSCVYVLLLNHCNDLALASCLQAIADHACLGKKGAKSASLESVYSRSFQQAGVRFTLSVVSMRLAEAGSGEASVNGQLRFMASEFPVIISVAPLQQVSDVSFEQFASLSRQNTSTGPKPAEPGDLGTQEQHCCAAQRIRQGQIMSEVLGDHLLRPTRSSQGHWVGTRGREPP